MFTGIIEAMGVVQEVKRDQNNMILTAESPISKELKIDQSVAHNGVCLTVTHVENNRHRVVLVDETLKKSNFGIIQTGDIINLERCLRLGDRLDGHMVQGHIDTTAICEEIVDQEGSWVFTFKFDTAFEPLLIEKGSVCVQGVSLTCFDVEMDQFKVAIIPYTYHHTNLSKLTPGMAVNIEFDIIGKYLLRYQKSGLSKHL